MEYYIYKIEYKGVLRYFLWYSDEDCDRFLIKENHLCGFSTLSAALDYGQENHLIINDDGMHLIIKGEVEPLDCNYFLTVWNLVSDICDSLGIDFWGNRGDKAIEKIYNKVFWGSNLKTLTPSGKYFVPEFSNKEKLILKRLYVSFLKVFSKYIANQMTVG